MRNHNPDHLLYAVSELRLGWLKHLFVQAELAKLRKEALTRVGKKDVFCYQANWADEGDSSSPTNSAAILSSAIIVNRDSILPKWHQF